MNIDRMLQGYVACALWSSIDEQPDGNGGPPLDDNYGPEDVHPDTLAKMRADCEDFAASNAADLAEYCAERAGLSVWSGEELAGHDFWLTRNGHGAGFWDRGLGALGDRLADAARVYGSVDLYVADGQVHA